MFVGGRDYISSNEILNEAFEMELKSIGRREQMRVSGVMVALGWEQKIKKIGGKNCRKWIPPVTEDEPVIEPPAKPQPQPALQPPPGEPPVSENKPQDWQEFETLLIAAETYAELENAKELFSKELRQEVMTEWKTDWRYDWLGKKSSELKASRTAKPTLNSSANST